MHRKQIQGVLGLDLGIAAFGLRRRKINRSNSACRDEPRSGGVCFFRHGVEQCEWIVIQGNE